MLSKELPKLWTVITKTPKSLLKADPTICFFLVDFLKAINTVVMKCQNAFPFFSYLFSRKPSSWIHICRRPNQGSICFSRVSLLSAETANWQVSKHPHLFDILIRCPLFVLEVWLLKQVQLLGDVALCSGLFLALMWYFQETVSRWYTRWQFNHISLSYWANLVYSLFSPLLACDNCIHFSSFHLSSLSLNYTLLELLCALLQACTCATSTSLEHVFFKICIKWEDQ